ncbi:MAG: hypothetical protein JNK49_00865 [Planctomycetes bacterium]|nr:hypothetical protein [Planctomycetota bacterium]
MHHSIAALQGLTYLTLGLALAVPRLRRVAVYVAVLAALCSLVVGSLDPETRTLTTVHTYAGFEGADQEVSMVSFPTGQASAAGWLWPLPFAGFALLWILLLVRAGATPLRQPWLWPLLLAWTATAQWLAMQWLAAPAPVVQPLGIDRFLFPAGVALALGAAHTAPTLLSVLFRISAGTVAARLPAALWSKFASDQHLGTSLDISAVRDIVNPMTGLQFEPRLVPGSGQQQFWLIWLEHVVMFPALYLLSLTGIAFAAYMIRRHGAN